MERLNNDNNRDYNYELTAESNVYEITKIFHKLYGTFQIRLQRARIKEECIEIKKKIAQKTEQNKNADEMIKRKLEIIMKQYNDIEKEATDNFNYYLNIIYELRMNYLNNSKKCSGKDILIKSCKSIFDLAINIYIKYEKKIILYISLIKDIKKLYY